MPRAKKEKVVSTEEPKKRVYKKKNSTVINEDNHHQTHVDPPSDATNVDATIVNATIDPITDEVPIEKIESIPSIGENELKEEIVQKENEEMQNVNKNELKESQPEVITSVNETKPDKKVDVVVETVIDEETTDANTEGCTEGYNNDYIIDYDEPQFILEDDGINEIIETTNILNEINEKEFILNEVEVNDILTECNEINKETTDATKYKLDDFKHIFFRLNDATLLIQIIDGKITFMEKRGNESRNQSVIELLHETNNYKKLPDCQFVIFTNDFIEDESIYKSPNLLTFCKKKSYETTLFPNFNFNHWLEAKIDKYPIVYDKFLNEQIDWNDKEDKIYWTGSIKTNIVRRKVFESSKSQSNYNIQSFNATSEYVPIYEVMKYKYLLNMNGYSYGGRLNYLFLSGSCVIILRNKDVEKDFAEFFYKDFIPNVDYLEIWYDDDESGETIIERVNNAIKEHNCEEIAKNCHVKAKEVFKMENIYEYIHSTLTDIANKSLIDHTRLMDKNTFYTSNINYFHKNLFNSAIGKDRVPFSFMGRDFEFNILDNNKNLINFKVLNDNTKVFFNEHMIADKYTPFLLNDKKANQYEISLENNIFQLIVDSKFHLIKADFNNLINTPFNISRIDVKTENGGWWFC